MSEVNTDVALLSHDNPTCCGTSNMPEDTHAAVDIASRNNSGQLWSEVISRKQKRPASLQQSVVAAVYEDQATKKRREKSLITVAPLVFTSFPTYLQDSDA
jgi:hypothetical protein